MKYVISFLLLFGIIHNISATHNRAGEISITQIGSLTVRATIVTYTKASSISADRDTLDICWGDGFCQRVTRSNGPGNKGEVLENDTKRNYYIAEHTYSGIGTYRVSMTDPNRNAGVLNVNFPNSDNIPFHIETVYTLFNPNLIGPNSTPILLQPPIDIGCVGQRFVHNPNAYDIDGDSLSYALTVPLQANNAEVPNYRYPDAISSGSNNLFSINSKTGEIIWDSPQRAGEYNIAIFIIEYRNGRAIDTLIRDMQVLITNCKNSPPIVDTRDELCVIAGELVQFNVSVSDPDIPKQKVKLTAGGGPFSVDVSKATLTVAQGFQNQILNGTFRWQTACEHISNQPYQVVFKGLDDFFDTSGLATLKTVRIKVVGPPPKNLQAIPNPNHIDLFWEKPYLCDSVSGNYFWAFSVWRKELSNPFAIDKCTPGLKGRGYTQIAPKVTEVKNGQYYFQDTDVERGKTYCYRILAVFAKRTSNNFPYNFVESLASDEVCVQLSRDVPLLTNVSVQKTDAVTGEIFVKWVRPSTKDLDTLLNKGPYVYQLQGGVGQSPATYTDIVGARFSTPFFNMPIDSMFTHQNLNTSANTYSYKIAFFVNNETKPLGFSEPSSSVFLTVTPTDRKNILSWSGKYSWNITEYHVYKKNKLTGVFDSIATTTTTTYTDKDLENGENYCYKILAIGTYNINNLPSPLLNWSQEVCATPFDNVPPCPPTLVVDNICTQPENFREKLNTNLLGWKNPNLCNDEVNDPRGYKVYYSKDSTQFNLIATITSGTTLEYAHELLLSSIAGCYYVTALDDKGNESAKSNILCVDNCPEYSLPNAFTPNGDNQNDVFKPYPYRFIAKVEFAVFNRWGELLFETTDPNIGWDGKTKSGKEVEEGTYFYTCRVFEQLKDGVMERPTILSGYIQVVR